MTTVFPGDDLVPDARIVIDRRATFGAPPDEVWPWLVQLGKGRGGWYFPGWLERVVPARRRGLRRIEPGLQGTAPRDEIPDWGPGDPVFRAMQVDSPRALVYLSLRDPARGHRWPASDARPPAPEVLALSWALLLSDDGRGGTDLHIRLRIDKGAWRSQRGARRIALLRPFMDGFDWLTIVGLFAGLRERLG